jgi:hypothetical protein
MNYNDKLFILLRSSIILAYWKYVWSDGNDIDSYCWVSKFMSDGSIVLELIW